MKWYVVDPEVPAELGPLSVLDTTVHPPKVSALHLYFQDWLGDDLIETFPCFAVSDDLAQDLREAGITGFSLEALTATQDADYVGPGFAQPTFEWLRITGRPYVDDLGITDDHRLLASERAMKVLARHRLEHADIEVSAPPNSSGEAQA